MTATCPNCGKPLRKGAKFCGSCGFEISSKQSVGAEGEISASTEMKDVCPFCGKSVRPGAKFCNSCGREIEHDSKEKAPDVISQTEESEKLVHEQVPVKSEVKAPPPTPSTAKAEQKPKRKKSLFLLLILFLVLICLVIVAGAYLYIKDPLGLFNRVTPTTMPASISTDTPLPIETEEMQVTPTLLPSSTITPTITLQPTEIITLTETELPEISATRILFEDDFDGSISAYWKSWGKPRPKISKGPGDNWMDLAASEDYGSGGVTSREQIFISPGAEIIFRGQLNDTFPQFKLLFDWDPLQFMRGPENQDPTVIHFEILRNRIILHTPLTNNRCEKDLVGTQTHTYRFVFLGGDALDLFIDEDEFPLCQISDIGDVPVPGTITFTGVGWVTYVQIIQPVDVE